MVATVPAPTQARPRIPPRTRVATRPSATLLPRHGCPLHANRGRAARFERQRPHEHEAASLVVALEPVLGQRDRVDRGPPGRGARLELHTELDADVVVAAPEPVDV